jgi:23S rRNA pseudouridine2605 synthase
MPEVRLQKAIARSGLCSRRQAERAIAAGRVTINGAVVQAQGTKVDAARDRVAVDGRPLGRAPAEHWLLHKPVGAAMRGGDPWCPDARALVPTDTHLFAVGRLDVRTGGLLLFTNDGDLAARLVRSDLDEVSHLRVAGRPDAATVRTVRRAVSNDDAGGSAVAIEVLSRAASGTWLRVTAPVRCGRDVRRALGDVGHPVQVRLRVAYGPLELGPLAEACARRLTPEERAAVAACTCAGRAALDHAGDRRSTEAVRARPTEGA